MSKTLDYDYDNFTNNLFTHIYKITMLSGYHFREFAVLLVN